MLAEVFKGARVPQMHGGWSQQSFLTDLKFCRGGVVPRSTGPAHSLNSVFLMGSSQQGDKQHTDRQTDTRPRTLVIQHQVKTFSSCWGFLFLDSW